MRAMVVYESMWGNTATVGEAVADGLRGKGVDADLVEVTEAPAEMSGVDLLVVGGPTHAFSMSRPSTRQEAVKQGGHVGHVERGIREWLDALPRSGQLAVATYDTRVAKVRHLPGSAARKAAKEVRRHHAGRVVASESFYVYDSPGPLLDGELERARDWGAQLASQV